MTDTKPTAGDTGYRLSDRYVRSDGTVLLTGIQALARLPIEQLRRDRAAGLDTAAFLSGYPGSPLGGFDQEIARAAALVADLPIVHRPAVNEELGATGVMGSQLASARADSIYDGVTGYWYGKAPGLDRAGDALRHAVFAGTSPNGGAVALVGDDPACKSSTMPSSSDATFVDLHMPIVYPGTVGECLELGLHAVAMSRATGLWSAIKVVTPVADGSGTVEFPLPVDEPVIPTVEIDGERWVSHPSAQFLGRRSLDIEREFREIRLPLARRYGLDNGLNRITVDPHDAWIGFVATGFTYHELLDTFRRLGFPDHDAIAAAGIRLLQLRMPVPFDADLVRSFATGLSEIVVVEEKNPTLEWLVKDALYGSAHQPLVVGKAHEDGRTLMRAWGQLDADAMLPGVRERLADRLGDRLAPVPEAERTRSLIPLTVNRTPFFCSGCPHNWGTKVPDGALVSAGTGCHGMILIMDDERVGESIGLTAMGNEGAQWTGMEPFVEADHLFQNYGDGTFFHSGQLAIQHCIASGLHMTFKILYNGTVAMTGGQDAPGAVGVREIAQIVLAHGATAVAVTTDDVGRYRRGDLPAGVEVHDRADIIEVQEQLRALPGVTVLIHDQACAAELRRDRKRGRIATPARRVVINHRICEGCGDCGDVSNCLSVQPIDTPLGRKTTIDQASCNYDESCLQGDCPAFMTVEVDESSGSETGSTGQAPARPRLPDELPPPPRPAAGGDGIVRIRMAGIGGTGVVTVAQILSTAATIEGWQVRGLDQTGLSQKAGPVISDIVMSRLGAHTSNLVGSGQAHLLLAFDALVGSSDAAIAAASPERTVVVSSTHRTPTGSMISRPETPYPAADTLADRFAARTVADRNRFVDTVALCGALVGSAAVANVFLLGVAVQDGSLPVSVDAVERAIDLNGVAVDANLAAFRWGRAWAADPASVEQSAVGRLATPFVTVEPLPRTLARKARAVTEGHEALGELVSMLAADLIEYQDRRYASSFLDAVAEAADAERLVDPRSSVVTEAVARNLHKLMAYKDEYEVARLMLLPESAAAVESVGGRVARATWQLHPPLLAALGRDGKIGFGARTRPLFSALRRAKRLRGTRADPFGRTEIRQLERELPGEYVAAMRIVYEHLDDVGFARAAEIASLPDLVRGYEDLKLRRIGEYRDRLRDALAHVDHH